MRGTLTVLPHLAVRYERHVRKGGGEAGSGELKLRARLPQIHQPVELEADDGVMDYELGP